MTRPSLRLTISVALAVALVAWLLLLTVKMPATTLPTSGSSSSSQPATGQKSYPGCSFDGDFTNDKPGACPERAKRYKTHP